MAGGRLVLKPNESYRQKAYFGLRDSLFSPVFSRSSIAGQMTEQAMLAVQAALTKLAREARDKARYNAPVDSGALRASIYITTAPSVSAQRAGKLSKGSSHGYYAAIQAAGRHKGIEPDTGGDMISKRTQRPLASTSKEHFAEMKKVVKEDLRTGHKRTVSEFDQLLPFNPIAVPKADEFYVNIGVAMYYAAWVEFGHSRGRKYVKARPFFTPAVDWAIREAPKRVAQAMKSLGGV